MTAAEDDFSSLAGGFIPQLSSARVAVAGLGLMGGSLAMALRGSCALLLGVDPDPETIRKALERGVVDKAASNPGEILPLADVIILAAPVRSILRLLQDLDALHPGPAVVLDLGSTKRQVLAAMHDLPERFEPLGGHPICGKEKSSLAYADPGLYQGAVFILSSLPRTSARAEALALELVSVLGACPVWLEAEAHDRWIAATSHLPYLVANALAQSTPIDAAPLVGPGFRSTTRLAGSFAPMMLDVLLTNREAILPVIAEFQKEFETLAAYLRRGDERALREYLHQSAQHHAGLLESQQANLSKVDHA